MESANRRTAPLQQRTSQPPSRRTPSPAMGRSGWSSQGPVGTTHDVGSRGRGTGNPQRRQGRSQVVIGGIEAHVCVLQTAIDLASQGFEDFVVADAVGSRAKASRKLGLARLQKSSVDVVDSEMVLFEWMERAGTPEFKQLQALIK